MYTFDNNRIKLLRELKGLSMTQFADKINASRQLVHCWEKGVHIPNVVTLIKIANVFDIEIKFFFPKILPPVVNNPEYREDGAEQRQ